jgi:hypothetical protein
LVAVVDVFGGSNLKVTVLVAYGWVKTADCAKKFCILGNISLKWSQC